MSQTFARTLTFSFALLAMSAICAGADESRLVIRIYDTGAATFAARRTAAIRTAEAIVHDAGFVVEWRDCSTQVSAGCEQPRRDRDLIVRIMPTAASTPRGNSVEAGFRLGVAVLDPGTRAGEMATVFHDRVEAVAQRTGVNCGELLGRALAHEVGHLLLREMGHSRTGLMRAVWTDAELTSNRREDWVFAPSDHQPLRLGWATSLDLDLTQ